MSLARELVERLHAVLVEEIRARRPQYLQQPFTVAEIYQDLVPYRSHRDRVGAAMNGDYEHALLQLLAGEGGFVVLDSEPARKRLVDELKSSNPNTGIFREYAALDVRLNPSRIPSPRPPASSQADGVAPGAADGAAARASAGGEATPSAAGREGASGRREVTPPPRPSTLSDSPATPRSTAEAPAPPAAPASTRAGASPVPPALGESPPASAARGDASPPAVHGHRSPAPGAIGRSSPTPGAAGHRSPTPGAAGHSSRTPGVPGDAAPPPTARSAPSNCRWCKAELPRREGLRFCPFCGTDVNLVPCPACGEELESGWRYCIACGAEAPSTG